MKDILSFLKWRWRKYSISEKFYLLGCMFFGLALGDLDGEYSRLFLLTGIAIWALAMSKWLVWDSTKSSWEAYKKERRDLFDKIDKGV